MLAPSIITAVVIRKKQQQQLQQQHQQEKNVALHLEIWNIRYTNRICAQHKHYSSIYRSGWGACSSRIMSSVQIYGTTLAPGTIIQTLISFLLYSRDICIVVHSHIYIRIANQRSVASYLFFFSSVHWGSLGFLPNSCLPIQMRRQLDQPQQQLSCSLYLLPFPNGLTVLKVTAL